jgi:hypothetical protein
MIRKLTAVGASLGVLLTASLADAQGKEQFGQQGQFILSADRLFPLFSFTRDSVDEFAPPPGTNKVTTTTTQTGISLLWGSTAPEELFFTVPRVGFDYVIVPNVTIGGDLVAFFTLGGSNDTETDFNNGSTSTQSNGKPSMTLFGIAPRGGYILQLSDLFSLWLRGGISFYTATAKTTDPNNNNNSESDNTHQFAIDLDPQLVITPIPHLGFTVGLTGDIPIAGGHSREVDGNGGSTTVTASASQLFIGITAGMLGYF